ncbi:hypothetical protein [Nitrosomonas sp.]|uniref:hypothetical protein n=1 Tax=Nitrosomonas sp. TaxID=42353 RepID=UPI0035B28C55
MKSMKYEGVAIMLLLMVTSVPQPSSAGPFLMTAEGYIYGQLSNVRQERSINQVYVGEISLGHESFSNTGSTHLWHFCFEKNRYEEIESFIGKNVVVEFKFPKSNDLLSCAQPNELLEIYTINQDASWEQKHFVGDIHTSDPEVSRGVKIGRITNLTKNKDMSRIYYMALQIGRGGSNFHHFMIDDHDLYDFAINALKNAALVKIHYSDRRSYGNAYGLGFRSVVAEIEVVDR